MVDIPFDIITHVAQWLPRTAPELAACNAVSCAWHLIFRRIIFCQLSLRGSPNGTYPGAHGQRNQNDPVKSPLQKLCVLLDQDPSIRDLVLTVQVRFDTHDPYASTHEPWFFDVPKFIHQQLPKVSTISFHALGEIYAEPLDAFCADLTLLTTVRSISFLRCCIPYRVVNGMVCSLPCLEDLHIHNQWLANGDGPFDLEIIPAPTCLPPRLKTFLYHNTRISGPTTSAFMNWIMPMKTLTAIGIHIDRVDAVPIVGRVLAGLGDSLEFLELRIIDDPWGSRWSSGLVRIPGE